MRTVALTAGKTAEHGYPCLGGPALVPCVHAMKYYDRDLYIRNAQGMLLAVRFFYDDLPRFERVKAALQG